MFELFNNPNVAKTLETFKVRNSEEIKAFKIWNIDEVFQFFFFFFLHFNTDGIVFKKLLKEIVKIFKILIIEKNCDFLKNCIHESIQVDE